jgi:Sulfotransferase domain
MSLPQRLLRNQRLRNLVPQRTKAAFAENRVRLLRVAHHTELVNVYHCCVHKTGSQWVRKVLADPDVYRATGLRTYACGPRLPSDRKNRDYPEFRFERPFPPKRIVSPLYIGHENFAAVPKREPWRAFFVARDPRDIVVSWYFSAARSHPTHDNPGLRRTREHLATLDEEQGLIYGIHRLGEYGLFDALRSWVGVESPEVLLVRFEDLTGIDSEQWWERLLDHVDVVLEPGERRALLMRYSFQALTGRQPGQEDPRSKLRRGVAGDWHNHFTPTVRAAFIEVAGDLVAHMGYADE